VSIPEDTVTAQSLNSFKNKLDTDTSRTLDDRQAEITENGGSSKVI